MYNVWGGGREGGKHGVSTYESKGSNPEESFKREVRTYVKHVLTWSRLSPGLDPRISRDPTQKKVLNAKSGPLSDMS